MRRARAALLHAGASAAVAALSALLVFGLWYPWPYTQLAGGTELFLLIAGVDVALGPLLTFCIWNTAKAWPVLRRDLAVILVTQITALGYGVHVMFAARPVALALEGERFRVISAVDVAVEELPEAPAGLRSLPWGGPRLIATRVPADPAEKFATAQIAMAGVDLGQRPRYWLPWDAAARAEARSLCRPLEALRRDNANAIEALDAAIAAAAIDPSATCYLPLLSRHGEWVALLDSRSGEVSGYLPFAGD